MTIQEYSTKVWPFYLRLEQDFINTLNYVEFSEDNYETYSIEYEKQLLSIGSEVDILCKLLCKEIDSNQSPHKIGQYANILCDFEDFISAQVIYEKTGKSYNPYENWTTENSPFWWKAYNKVKHNRICADNYKEGNLKNVFYALLGLYVLNRYYCKEISAFRLIKEPIHKSQIFSMVGWESYIPIGNGLVQVLHPDGNISVEKEFF